MEDAETPETLELFSDGTGIVSNTSEQYQYSITFWLGESGGLKITVQMTLVGEYTIACDYEITKDTLTLIEGDDRTLYYKEK